jgi:hypothetical protein
MHGIIVTRSLPIARLAGAAAVLLLAACATSLPADNAPASVEAPQLPVGKSWTYQVRDGYNHGLMGTLRYSVASAHDGTVTLRVEEVQGARAGLASRAIETATEQPVHTLAPRSLSPVDYTPAYHAYEFPLAVGKSWRRNYAIAQPGARPVPAQVRGQVAGWERIKVLAGEFDALRIERASYLDDEEFWRWGTRAYETDWYAPAVGRFVRHEERSEFDEKSGIGAHILRRGDWTVLELQSYDVGP